MKRIEDYYRHWLETGRRPSWMPRWQATRRMFQAFRAAARAEARNRRNAQRDEQPKVRAPQRRSKSPKPRRSRVYQTWRLPFPLLANKVLTLRRQGISLQDIADACNRENVRSRNGLLVNRSIVAYVLKCCVARGIISAEALRQHDSRFGRQQSRRDKHGQFLREFRSEFYPVRLLTFAEIADSFNRKNFRTFFGRPWTAVKLQSFVNDHRLALSERPRKRGGHRNTGKPYGTKPAEACYLDRMLRLAREGYSYSAIARKLTADCIPTRNRRSPWKTWTVSNILARYLTWEERQRKLKWAKPPVKRKIIHRCRGQQALDHYREIAKRLFALKQEGLSQAEIATRFDIEGWQSCQRRPGRGTWTAGSIGRAFRRCFELGLLNGHQLDLCGVDPRPRKRRRRQSSKVAK